MAELSTIARPYAAAAFDVANASPDSLDSWSRQLEFLAQAMREPKVLNYLSSPALTRDKRIETLIGLVDGEVSDDFRRFIGLLVDNKRYDAFPAIAAEFAELRNKQEDSATARIYSAYELSDKQIKKIVKDLQSKFNKKLKPEVTVDPELIGGVRVVVGDQVLDTSVQAQLQRLYHKLVA